MNQILKRHLFLLLLAVLMISSLAACGGADTGGGDVADTGGGDAAAATQEEAADDGVSANQAPAFQEMVRAGTLPPLDERLPVNPLVIEPVESVGQYGGIWRTGLRGGSDSAWIYRTIAYDQLVNWTRDWTGVRPNVAESWEINDDATEYIFKLREGMKWSDGEPFGADDIIFWYDDVILNEELTPSVPNWLQAGGEPAVVEKIDDHTVKFTVGAQEG